MSNKLEDHTPQKTPQKNSTLFSFLCLLYMYYIYYIYLYYIYVCGKVFTSVFSKFSLTYVKHLQCLRVFTLFTWSRCMLETALYTNFSRPREIRDFGIFLPNPCYHSTHSPHSPLNSNPTNCPNACTFISANSLYAFKTVSPASPLPHQLTPHSILTNQNTYNT